VASAQAHEVRRARRAGGPRSDVVEVAEARRDRASREAALPVTSANESREPARGTVAPTRRDRAAEESTCDRVALLQPASSCRSGGHVRVPGARAFRLRTAMDRRDPPPTHQDRPGRERPRHLDEVVASTQLRTLATRRRRRGRHAHRGAPSVCRPVQRRAAGSRRNAAAHRGVGHRGGDGSRRIAALHRGVGHRCGADRRRRRVVCGVTRPRRSHPGAGTRSPARSDVRPESGHGLRHDSRGEGRSVLGRRACRCGATRSCSSTWHRARLGLHPQGAHHVGGGRR